MAVGSGGTAQIVTSPNGVTWTATGQGLLSTAEGVVWTGTLWIVVGTTGLGSPTTTLLTSPDGVNWTSLGADIFTQSGKGIAGIWTGGEDIGQAAPPSLLSPVAVDETEWKVVRAADTLGTASLYSHPDDTPMDAGWTSTSIQTSQIGSFGAGTRFMSYVAQTVDPGADSTLITFPLPNNGPTFVSPTDSTYILWQYMPIPPLTFTASGTAPISYFVSSLPVGLVWNSITRTVTGSCMRTGTQTFTVYAKDGAGGITAFTVTMLVEVPRIVKKQTSAGAYTSLVRQYTEVNAAQTARDSRALPGETSGIGEFASPYPPSVVTPSNCPC
jgi:hypothetical protein